MALAGVHHITIAPPLLQELASTSVDSKEKIPSLFAKTELSREKSVKLVRFGNDEAAFRMSFTRRDNGKAESKLIQVSVVQQPALLRCGAALETGAYTCCPK